MAVNYRTPNYSAIFAQRAQRLERLRNDPDLLAAVKVHYRSNPWDFINDWGMTFEPRNIERGLLPAIPFVLWPKQIEYLQWLYGMWRKAERGLVEKSRDCGVSWLSVGFAVAMWRFEDGFTAGFGSRKEELVDRRGDSKSIFEKVRFFIDNLPMEFIPEGFSKPHSAHMRVINPVNGAAIIGEAGDEIGRGGRTSIYLVDEAAFIEHQDSVDAALSQNTNCQIDISTPNGSGNEFYRKRMRYNNTHKVFIFDWRDDPRKDDAWYQKQKQELDEVIVAQEIDRDYNASAEDSFIPAKWVAAAIDAHKKLGFGPQGIRVTGFDPADTGDAKATVNRHGSVILQAKQLKQGDITQAMPWAFEVADQFRADVLSYDGDGMGAPAMKLTLIGLAVGRMKVIAYHGSAGVLDPEKKPDEMGKARRKLKPAHERSAELHRDDATLRTNTDTYTNFRSQTWSWVRDRFELTYEAVQRASQGQIVNVDPEDLISISSECESLIGLQAELSRPKRIFTKNGKIQVESKKEMKTRSVDSPNLADALIIAMSVRKPEPQQKQPVNVRSHRVNDRTVGY